MILVKGRSGCNTLTSYVHPPFNTLKGTLLWCVAVKIDSWRREIIHTATRYCQIIVHMERFIPYRIMSHCLYNNTYHNVWMSIIYLIHIYVQLCLWINSGINWELSFWFNLFHIGNIYPKIKWYTNMRALLCLLPAFNAPPMKGHLYLDVMLVGVLSVTYFLQ